MGLSHARVVDPGRREEERIARPMADMSFGELNRPPSAAAGVSLRSWSQPEAVASPGMTALVESGAKDVVPLSPRGATSRRRSASSKDELPTSSKTRPSVAKAALLYAGVVFGMYAGRLSSRFLIKTSRVHPPVP